MALVRAVKPHVEVRRRAVGIAQGCSMSPELAVHHAEELHSLDPANTGGLMETLPGSFAGTGTTTSSSRGFTRAWASER